ncbi:MAG: hypothetical protein EAZ82_07735 [Verrucomicrobia bacterium]|nr:MAG: hypothetical protein EAZ82_07735 [Verrucomicrobiota bacterium]
MKATTPKTILIAGNMAGMQYTSTLIGTLGDGLQALGYSAKYVAIDIEAKPMLQKLHPSTVHIRHYDSAATDDAVYNSPADITMIDCPLCYKIPHLLIPPTDCGYRIVTGIVVNTRSERSIAGGIEFAKTFNPISSGCIVLAVAGRVENSAALNDGKERLTEISGGRVICFPRFTMSMCFQNALRPTVPSGHIAQARNEKIASDWRGYQKETLESISSHAEWLTGKPIPKP